MLATTVLLLAVAGCSSSPESSGTTTAASGTTTTTSAPARTGTPLPTYVQPSVDAADATTMLDRCGVDAPGKVQKWTVAGGALEGIVVGEGATTAIFLAQTDNIGMCGWAEYAAWASGQGVRAVLWNRCGDGESTCGDAVSGKAEAQTKVVVDWVRANGADRVVLVGASKGGGIALAAAQPLAVDAVIDLSGSLDGSGGEFTPIAEAAARTKVPLLLAMTPGDQDEAVMRTAFDSSPATPKEFIAMERGHGWDYVADPATSDDVARVSDFGERVLRWVKGDYS